jgi:hypothetical protein
MNRAQVMPKPVTEIAAQTAIVAEDGSHRSNVSAIRRSTANTWLTFDSGPLAGQTIRYSNGAQVTLERPAANGPLGKPTHTGAVRGWNRYGTRS